MNSALLGMLDRYRPESLADHENALKEIVQELALLGLWRAKFFEHAAFYGGTALRIFHRLPRFSEDIDFSLMHPDRDFDLAPHLEAIRMELAAFGFSFRVERRIKRVATAIESAFIKGGTRINLAHIGAPDYLRARLPELHQVRIRIELDTDPPPLAEYEVLPLLTPIPFHVCESAGKVTPGRHSKRPPSPVGRLPCTTGRVLSQAWRSPGAVRRPLFIAAEQPSE